MRQAFLGPRRIVASRRLVTSPNGEESRRSPEPRLGVNGTTFANMPVADGGPEPGGHRLGHLLSNQENRLITPLRRSQVPESLSKSEQKRTVLLRRLLRFFDQCRLGKFCALMNLIQVASGSPCRGETNGKNPRQDSCSDRE